MPRLGIVLTAAVLFGLSPLTPAPAQDDAPAVKEAPVFRLEGDGPLSPVTGLAFGPDGTTLYEAGWDKVVRVWRRDPATRRFALDAPSCLRTPIGPGSLGVLNALAVSGDGNWVAVGGNAVSRELAGFRQTGLVVPRAGTDPLPQGVIYAFDLRATPATARRLVGHRGQVVGLTFVDAPAGSPPRLLSAGSEADGQLTLRVWDVAGGKEIGRADAGANPELLQFLAAWTLPPEHARVRVAVARKQAGLLAWDVGDGPTAPVPIPVADPFRGVGLVVSYRPGRGGGELLTGHLGIPPGGGPHRGLLASWDASRPPAQAAPTRSSVLRWTGAEPAPKGAAVVPLAQALVASVAGGPRDLVAVVTRSSGEPRFRLQLVDLAPAAFGTVRAEVDLWNGQGTLPVAASSPDGSRLAIAGGPAHEVLVFETADLLKEPPATPQRLRGSGEAFGAVTFAKKGVGRGLWFHRARPDPRSNRPPAGPRDVVFDVANRRFARPADGWEPARPAPETWQTLAVDGPGVWVYENGNAVRQILITSDAPPKLPGAAAAAGARLAVTALAVVPPVAPLLDPVVAVALVESGVGPSLWLYNGRSGERFRKLSGHAATIRGLAFSDDGRFLVSSADDLTACVWSLTDLDRIVHARGTMPGVALKDEGGRIAVAAPGAVGLRTGDVVEGVVEPGRLVAVKSALDVIFAAAARKPGQTLSLRVRNGLGPPRDVALALRQAVDERKPMFTFFLKRADGAPEWLAWSPLGPYDSSGPVVDALFGWHFNEMENPATPARFALAAKYPQYRSEGLIGDLFRGLPPRRAEAPRRKPPILQVFVDAKGVLDPQDVLAVRRTPTRLRLALDDPVPPEELASVTWRFDGGPPRPLTRDDAFWTADLAGTAWGLRPHTLAVALRLKDPDGRTFTKDLLVRHAPAPPRLVPRAPDGGSWTAWGRQIAVQEPRYRVAAEVVAVEGVKPRAVLVHGHEGRTIRRQEFGPDFAGKPGLDTVLELRPGSNTIELVAVNDGAPDGESVRLGPLTVHYSPKPVEPPSILLEALVLLPDSPGAAPRRSKIEGGDSGVVNVSRVRLEGEVKGKPTAVDWQLAPEGRQNADVWKPVDGFKPGAEAVACRQEIELVPGRQTIRVRARGVDETPAATRVVTLVVECRPTVAVPLDLVVEAVDPPTAPGAVPTRVKVSATIEGDPTRHPVETAAVLVDDEKTAEPPTIDAATGRLSAAVELHTGRNRVRVRLGNRWSEPADSNEVVVTFRRPPLVEAVTVDRPGPGRSATVSARVTSRTPCKVEIVHRSSAAPAGPPRTEPFGRPGGVSEVRGGVTLDSGENTLVVRASNEDGEATPVGRTVTYVAPPAPKPVITAESPDVAEQRVYELRFRVTSESRLERVELARERASGRESVAVFDTARQQRRGDGVFELVDRRELVLDPFQNTFELAAVNAAGGRSTLRPTLTYTPRPVHAEIVAVESPDGRAFPDAAKPRAGGPWLWPEGRATLRGRVVWPDEESMLAVGGDRASDGDRVQVWVNGFPQVSAPLNAPRPGAFERDFRAAVVLSEPANNEIVVKLGDRPIDVHGDLKLRVDCRSPERKVRLHLWVIGVGVPREDASKLLDTAIRALNGEPGRDGKPFRIPAFPEAHLYGPDADRRLDVVSLSSTMNEICKTISLRDAPEYANEVVMIYYQGGEIVPGEGGALGLRLRPGKNPHPFSLKHIRNTFAATRGAKLLLLDVTHGRDRGPIDLTDARWLKDDGRDDVPDSVGLLHVSWPQTPPDDINLGSMLREALHNRKLTLGEATREVDRQAAAMQSQFPGLRFLPELKPPLEKLNIGRVP